MTGPTYRRAARFYFEPAPRPPMAHPAPFIDHAHREPDPESLWRAVAVLLAGLAFIGFVGLVWLAVPG